MMVSELVCGSGRRRMAWYLLVCSSHSFLFNTTLAPFLPSVATSQHIVQESHRYHLLTYGKPRISCTPSTRNSDVRADRLNTWRESYRLGAFFGCTTWSYAMPGLQVGLLGYIPRSGHRVTWLLIPRCIVGNIARVYIPKVAANLCVKQPYGYGWKSE